jgi:hypothetical protein
VQRQGLKVETNNSCGAGEDKDGRENRESEDYGSRLTKIISKEYRVSLVKNWVSTLSIVSIVSTFSKVRIVSIVSNKR